MIPKPTNPWVWNPIIPGFSASSGFEISIDTMEITTLEKPPKEILYKCLLLSFSCFSPRQRQPPSRFVCLFVFQQNLLYEVSCTVWFCGIPRLPGYLSLQSFPTCCSSFPTCTGENLSHQSCKTYSKPATISSWRHHAGLLAHFEAPTWDWRNNSAVAVKNPCYSYWTKGLALSITSGLQPPNLSSRESDASGLHGHPHSHPQAYRQTHR